MTAPEALKIVIEVLAPLDDDERSRVVETAKVFYTVRPPKVTRGYDANAADPTADL